MREETLRLLQALVGGGDVRGWDDPRLPTLAGMRRRGLVPEGINSLCKEIGITRSEGYVQLKRLYHHVRLQLDAGSPRALAVLRPLKLVRPWQTRAAVPRAASCRRGAQQRDDGVRAGGG